MVDVDGGGGGGGSDLSESEGQPGRLHSTRRWRKPRSGTYDNEGNMFLAGADQSNNFEFAVIAEQGCRFYAHKSGRHSIGARGLGVGWDGAYVVVGAGNGVLYQTNGAGVTSRRAG